MATRTQVHGSRPLPPSHSQPHNQSFIHITHSLSLSLSNSDWKQNTFLFLSLTQFWHSRHCFRTRQKQPLPPPYSLSLKCTLNSMFVSTDFKWKGKCVMNFKWKTLFSFGLDCRKSEGDWTDLLWGPWISFLAKTTMKMLLCTEMLPSYGVILTISCQMLYVYKQ